MLEDYAQVVATRQVFVAVRDESIVGALVLAVAGEGFLLENIAVDPRCQGLGIGRALLELAETEATRRGYDSIYLYTNEKMTENLALYARLGYRAYTRRTENGYARVYLSKALT